MKTFKAIVDGTEYEIQMELVSDDGQGSASVMQNQALKRAPKNMTPSRPAQAAAPQRAAAPAPAPAPAPAAAPAGAGENIVSPLPGNVFDVKVAAGEAVKKGQVLFIIEAMKMENEIMAPRDGQIGTVSVTKGQTVNPNDVLCTLQ